MRIVGLFGISVVIVGFLLVVWKIARGKDFLWLVQRQVWALAVAIYLFALTPVDAIAVSYNVRNVLDGKLSASMQIGVQDSTWRALSVYRRCLNVLRRKSGRAQPR